MDFSFEENTLCRFITVQLSRLFQNKRIFLLLAICSAQLLQAQVGIGTAQPEPSAMLDIRANGNHKGLLIPRITTAEKNSITAPAEGLIIYQTDGDAGFYFFNGQDWKNSGGVTSINGLTPSNNGELTLNVPKTQIGTEADRIATTNPTDGLLHIVDGDSNAQNNGRVYVYSALLADWTLTTNFIDTDTDTDTDNQSISGSSFNALTNELTIGIENGNAQIVNLSGLSGTGTDSQTITAALVGNTLELLPQNTTTTVSVDLSSLAVTPTLEAVSAAGSSTTSTLVLSSVLPINSSVTIGNASNPWNSLNAQTTLSEHVSSTTVSASNISVAQFIRHDDDPDTYLLYNPDDIRFVSGGVDTVKILPNEVSVNDGSAAINFRVESDTNTSMLFVDGVNDRVGIGNNTPTEALEVSGSVSATGLIASDLGNPTEMVFVGPNKRLTSTPSVTITANGELVVSNVVSTTEIRVSGTISTTSDLFVEGDTRLEGDLTTTDADIVFEDQNSSYPTNGKGFFWRLNNDRAKIYAQQPSSDAINFVFYLDDNAGNDTDKYIFYNRDYNGNSNSRYPLTMSGRNFYVYAPPSGTAGEPDLTSWAMRVEPNGNVDISGNLTVDGNGTFGGTVTSSDRRLKSNIIESDFGLNEIMRLSPKTYNKYKSTKKEQLISKEIGFIAQEVKGIIPELVSFIGKENNLYGISYDMLIPVLTKAIQEQQIQIKALKKESKAMEIKYNDLLQEVQKIKAWIQSSEATQ